MNAETTHTLCDAILGLQSQVSDVLETVGALLELANGSLPNDGRLDTTPAGEQLAHYVVQLANTHARAQALVATFSRLAATRQSLEASHARLNRDRWSKGPERVRAERVNPVNPAQSRGNS